MPNKYRNFMLAGWERGAEGKEGGQIGQTAREGERRE